MPDNYPEEWKRKFAQGYQEAAENIEQVDTSKPPQRAGPPPETTPHRRSLEDTRKPLPYADDPNWVSPFATAGSDLADDPNATVVSLSQINPEVLADERGPETGPVGFERAESDMSEHDFVTLGPDGVPIAGLMQAGMNEPSGALGAPSELSLQHTTYSGKVRLRLRQLQACLTFIQVAMITLIVPLIVLPAVRVPAAGSGISVRLRVQSVP